MSRRRRRDHGFTIIEVMIVVFIIGLMATFAIPRFFRAAARAQRSEMWTVLEKERVYFINLYRTNGRFPVPAATVEWNPDNRPGPKIDWRPLAAGWEDFTFPPEGGVRMRYTYSTDGQILVMTAKGSFPGMDTVYQYVETYSGENLLGIAESPEF